MVLEGDSWANEWKEDTVMEKSKKNGNNLVGFTHGAEDAKSQGVREERRGKGKI